MTSDEKYVRAHGARPDPYQQMVSVVKESTHTLQWTLTPDERASAQLTITIYLERPIAKGLKALSYVYKRLGDVTLNLWDIDFADIPDAQKKPEKLEQKARHDAARTARAPAPRGTVGCGSAAPGSSY